MVKATWSESRDLKRQQMNSASYVCQAALKNCQIGVSRPPVFRGPLGTFFSRMLNATRWQLLPTRWQWVCLYPKALVCFTTEVLWCMWPLKPQICWHPGCYQFGKPPQSRAWHTVSSLSVISHSKNCSNKKGRPPACHFFCDETPISQFFWCGLTPFLLWRYRA